METPATGLSSTGLPDQTRVAKTLAWAAAVMALALAVGLPGGFFWLSYRAESRESEVAARLHAAFLTQVIVQADADWRRDIQGLIETDLAPSVLPEQRLVLDKASQAVSVSGPAVAAPWVTTRATLAGPDGPVGQVEIVRSLRPLMVTTAMVGGAGTAVGLAIFLVLRVMRARALSRALQQLRGEAANQRAAVEANLRTLFEQAIEGILTLSDDGCVVSGNPAAARIWACQAADLRGRPLSALLERVEPGDSGSLMAAGHFEAVALGHDQRRCPVDVSVNHTAAGHDIQRIVFVRDISERKGYESRMVRLANIDELTGLPNRTVFRDRLHQGMARARRSGNPLALMFLDLDRFKLINDSLGHQVGDRLLQQVAEVLAACLRETDTLASVRAMGDVYRLGGDEFTIVVENLSMVEDAAAIAARVLHALSRPLVVDGECLYVSASIGITLFPRDDNDLDGLIRQADMAMYQSKERERGTCSFFDPALGTSVTLRHDLETGLRMAMQRQEFALHYQPKASLHSGEVTGVEALLRWNRPGLKPVGPDRFIPILEDLGLIVPVGDWVLTEACRQLAAWRRAGLPAFTMAVNLSARQLRQPNLVERVRSILAQTGIEPECLELELTESMLVTDEPAALGALKSLAAMGVKLAIDDFGTGQSSLSYLKQLQLNTLKIDRAFVKDTPADQRDCAIAAAVVALARGLQLKTVAEGVETAEQVDFLTRLGCDEMQGYLLSRPLPASQLSAWLEARQAAREARLEPVH